MSPGNSPRRRAGFIAAAAVFCTLAACTVAWAAGSSREGLPAAEPVPLSDEGNGAYVPGEAVVRFEPGTSPAVRREARIGASVELEDTIGLPQAQLVAVDGSVGAAVRRLESQPGVAYAQPNYRYRASAVEPPDDTFFGALWGLDNPAMPAPGVGVLDAWEDGKGGGQVIAVLDTGVDLTHPDLVGRLWENPTPGPDVHGYDFVDDDPDPDDYNFHGTHVAGTAAASAGNTQGIAGVAPEAEVMAVRVLDGDGSGTTAGIAAGIEYATAHEADVINMSLGGPSGAGDQAMQDAIAVAGEADVVVVAAAGNEGANNDAEPHTPCALANPNLICVAALDQKSGALAGFSNYGFASVDIAAPGTSILSTKTHYGAPLFSDGFESGLGLWVNAQSNGGKEWVASSLASSGSSSATDSAGDYGAPLDPTKFSVSELFSDAAVNLSLQHGCRVHFQTMYQIEPPPAGGFYDVFVAGAVDEESGGSLLSLAGTSDGYPELFDREEVSVSALDGRDDVHPIFGIFADELLEFDGAYVDDVRLICRAHTGYVNAIASPGNYDQPGSGNYVRFQGTSMATPHVAGVVALVRAAEPSLDAEGVVDAVLAGASAMPEISLGKRTATEGIADACKAIAVATGADVAAKCPASSEPVPQPPDAGVPPAIPVQPDSETQNPFPPGASAVNPPTDRRRPSTYFKRRPRKAIRTAGRSARAVFSFGSGERGVTFLCKVDRAPFRRCPALFLRRYRLGSHVLRVKARDAAGNVDRTPAVYRFGVEPL